MQIRDLLFPSPPLTLSESQLALHDGSNPSEYPLYVAIDGDVYDVSDGGIRNYGPGGAYSAFAGRDAARGAFKDAILRLRILLQGYAMLMFVENRRAQRSSLAASRRTSRTTCEACQTAISR